MIDFPPKSNCAGCQRNTDIANAVAVQRDGKIVAAGSTDFHGVCDDMGNSCDTFALVRFKEGDFTVRIEGSLIGKDVVIRRTDQMPKALRFMLGDLSEVELT